MSTNLTEEERKKIIELREQGYSVLDIAMYMRRGTSTVRRIIREHKNVSE